MTNILDLNIHESRNTEFFKNIFLKVLNKHTIIKMKYLRANHAPFVTKELSKAIMLRSKLQNRYLKCKSEEARAHFKIQENLCVTKVNGSKNFWNTIKPLFVNKVSTRNNISWIENKISYFWNWISKDFY